MWSMGGQALTSTSQPFPVHAAARLAGPPSREWCAQAGTFRVFQKLSPVLQIVTTIEGLSDTRKQQVFSFLSVIRFS